VVAIFALAKTWPKQFLLASGSLVLMGVNYVVLVNFGNILMFCPRWQRWQDMASTSTFVTVEHRPQSTSEVNGVSVRAELAASVQF